MAGSYRPRPAENKVCIHCGNIYESRHKRTMYCGSSCRTLAYNARQGIFGKSAEPVKAAEDGEIALTASNVAVMSLGAVVAGLGNYLFNDLPAQEATMTKLATMDKDIAGVFSHLIRATQMQIDFNNAQLRVNPSLQMQLKQVIQERQTVDVAKATKLANKKEIADRLIEANRKRRLG